MTLDSLTPHGNRFRSLLTAIVALLVCTPVGSSRQPESDPRFEQVAAIVRAKMKEFGVPGVALGISHRGARLSRGFGVTSVENPLPVTERTLFQAGSITKTFTATLVMSLVEDGRLSLDTPVRAYLPTFRVRDDEASRLATTRTLLTHMGGWEGDLFDDPGPGDDALGRIVERMASLEQVARFNTIWSYNNAGFYVAGRLVELATKTPYETAIRERLLSPLGLRQTFLSPEDVLTYRFAAGHAGPPASLVVLRPWGLPRAMRPAGGVITTVDDLMRYGEFHAGSATVSSTASVLSPAGVRQLQATQVVKQGSDDEMALGWQVSQAGKSREVWHDGFAVGQTALLSLVPSEQLVVALMTNSIAGERFNREIRRAVMAEYLGVQVTDPMPVQVGTAELTEFLGRYSRPFMDVIVTAGADHVMIQQIQKQGFPRPGSRVPPPGPPARFVFYAKDRLVGEGAVRGDHAEFVRRPDGVIGWMRIGGRVAARVSRQQ